MREIPRFKKQFGLLLLLLLMLVGVNLSISFYVSSNKSQKTSVSAADKSAVRLDVNTAVRTGSMDIGSENNKTFIYFRNHRDGSATFIFTPKEDGDYRLDATLRLKNAAHNKVRLDLAPMVEGNPSISAEWQTDINQDQWITKNYPLVNSLFTDLKKDTAYKLVVSSLGNISVNFQVQEIKLVKKSTIQPTVNPGVPISQGADPYQGDPVFAPPITLEEFYKLDKNSFMDFPLDKRQKASYYYGLLPFGEVQDPFIGVDTELPAAVGTEKTFTIKPWRMTYEGNEVVYVPDGYGTLTIGLQSIAPNGEAQLLISGELFNTQPNHIYILDIFAYGFGGGDQQLIKINANGRGTITPFHYTLITKKAYETGEDYNLNPWHPLTSIVVYEDADSSPFVVKHGTVEAGYSIIAAENTAVCYNHSSPCLYTLLTSDQLDQAVVNYNPFVVIGNNTWPQTVGEQGIFNLSSGNQKVSSAKGVLTVKYERQIDQWGEEARLNNGKNRFFVVTGTFAGLEPGKKYELYFKTEEGYGSNKTFTVDSRGNFENLSGVWYLSPTERVSQILITEKTPDRARTIDPAQYCIIENPCLTVNVGN